MCHPRTPPSTEEAMALPRSRWSPVQVWKALRHLTLSKTSKIRSVTGHAKQKVRRVQKWVFNFTFSKIVLPLLILCFLLALNPYKDIQIGVAVSFVLFFFVFCISTREVLLCASCTGTKQNTPELEVVEEFIIAKPSPWLQLYSLCHLNQVSRLWGAITSKELPWPFNILSVWLFAVLTRCDRKEAEYSDLSSYKTVSQFFTRRLQPGLRPISAVSELVSPCDGTVTYSGLVEGPHLQQVKGVLYSLRTFIGALESINTDTVHPPHPQLLDHERLLLQCEDSPVSRLYQTVFYLAPCDYHRFHSPCDWTVYKRRYFPGRLHSVAPPVVRRLPGLFHSNERVAFLGRWAHGFFALVAVGATSVGSIRVHFDPELSTNTGDSSHMVERVYDQPVVLRKGEEFGYFNFGSTLVLIYQAPGNTGLDTGGGRVRVGEGMWL